MLKPLIIAALLPAGAAGAQVPAAPPPLPLAADAEARFKAGCRKQVLAANPGAAKWVGEECATRWQAVAAAGPGADALLGVIPATPGEALPLATAKARMAGVRWGAPALGALAAGQLGALRVSLQGKRQPEKADVSWSKAGALIPYDVAGAMTTRGVRLTLVGCEQLGVGESSRTYSGAAPGRAPFALTVDSREAPTADAISYYAATVSLGGRAPPRGSIACETP